MVGARAPWGRDALKRERTRAPGQGNSLVRVAASVQPHQSARRLPALRQMLRGQAESFEANVAAALAEWID